MNGVFKSHRSRPAIVQVPKVDLRAPDAVAQFQRAADALTAKILQSKDPDKAIRAIMVREGILTKKGNLTARYRQTSVYR